MKKLTVTVAIPAYNEENIRELLLSVVSQIESNYKIVEILVISDGSTDSTAQQARTVEDKRIKIFDYKLRLGKSSHLNTLFKQAKGDYIALFDADVVLAHRHVITELINTSQSEKNIGLVGGETKAQNPRNFMEKAINIGIDAYKPLRLEFKDGNNVFNCIGQILFIKKGLATKITVPTDMIANDQFLYFSCLSKEYKFKHSQNALVLYRSATSILDYIKQSQRFYAARKRLRKLFKALARREYNIPTAISLRTKLKYFTLFPLHTSLIFILNIYCACYGIVREVQMNAKWPMALSTKKAIKYEN